jgi:hypothetical protein
VNTSQLARTIWKVALVISVLLALVASFLLDKGTSLASIAVHSIKIALSGAAIMESSVATADFNGDGYKEIVAGGTDGMLYVISFNGSTWSTVWSRQTNLDIEAANPPTHTVDNNIRSSPAIADLDGDSRLDIVVAVGGDVHDPLLSKHRNGGVLVYEYNSPWNFSLASGWPQPKIDQVGWPPPGYSNADGYWDGIVSTPALGDLDGDGDLEIVVLGIDRRIHAWHHDGTCVAGWPISQWDGDALWRGGTSSPALGDIDGDGLPEVVVGTMSPCRQDQSNQNATLWAINGDSTNVPGFPVCVEQILHSSPALGDIDDDGRLEIVISAGWGTPGRQNIVYAFNHDGTLLPNWPQETAGVTMAPPALGDIDNDGNLEIVVGCGNSYDPGSCNRLYAWNTDGTRVFEITPTSRIPGYYAMPYSPVLADFDGDGTVEILIVHLGDWAVTVVEPDGSGSDSASHATGGGLLASPVVDDVDDDGKLEIVVGGIDYAGQGGAIYVWNEHGMPSSPVPWPMFHHDTRRTGYYPLPPSLSFPTEVSLLHQYGSGNTETGHTLVQNEGAGQLDWSITHAIPGLQVIPASGTVTDTVSVRLVITTTDIAPTGWHELGSLTITGTASGKPVDGSPITATLYLYVGEVSRAYLPLVTRNY